MPVAWFTREPLTAAIGRASVDRSNYKVIAPIARAVLIVVDDIGMLPAGQAAAAEAFCRLVDATYERRSLAESSEAVLSQSPKLWPMARRTRAARAWGNDQIEEHHWEYVELRQGLYQESEDA